MRADASSLRHQLKLVLFLLQSLPNILTDDRFKVMFENPDFQVDEESEEFRLLNPLVSRISEKRKKQLRMLEQQELQAKNVKHARHLAGVASCCVPVLETFSSSLYMLLCHIGYLGCKSTSSRSPIPLPSLPYPFPC